MDKKITTYFVLFLIIVLGVILFTCSSGDDKKVTKVVETDTIRTAEQQIPKISNIHFYLETSGSMKGYFGGDTDFAVTINNFVVDLNAVKEKTEKINLAFINSEVTDYDKPINTFITDVASLNLQMGRSSEIHKMIKSINDRHKENDISIFVSDFILSFPTDEVKKNREINKQNVQSVLKPYIKEEVAKLKKRDMAILVYAFTSNFNGKYFNYRNVVTDCNGCQRPYYMWVIGKTSLITILQERIEKMNFNPKAEMAFGMVSEPITENQIISFTERGKKRPYRLDDKKPEEVTNIDVKLKETFKFYSAIDLSSFPLKYQDEEFLKRNLQIETQNRINIDIISIEKSDTFLPSLNNQKEKKKILDKDYTHFILFEAKELVENTVISIQLEESRSTDWTKNWSTDDDLDVTQSENKTFAFSYLMDGVKEAYQLAETQKKYLVDYKIKFSTEK